MEKEKLDNLINLFLNKSINTNEFCDQFYKLYEFCLDKKELDAFERKLYSDLNYILSRFSMFPDEIEKYENTYYSEKDIRNKTAYIYSLLLEMRCNIEGNA